MLGSYLIGKSEKEAISTPFQHCRCFPHIYPNSGVYEWVVTSDWVFLGNFISYVGTISILEQRA